MTANPNTVRRLPSPSADTAWDAATVAEIAHWPDMISPAAHQQAHPRPIHGCLICPQSEACPWCGLPSPECTKPGEHYGLWRKSDQSLRTDGLVSQSAPLAYVDGAYRAGAA